MEQEIDDLILQPVKATLVVLDHIVDQLKDHFMRA